MVEDKVYDAETQRSLTKEHSGATQNDQEVLKQKWIPIFFLLVGCTEPDLGRRCIFCSKRLIK